MTESPFDLDGTLAGADWIRARTWDLWTVDGSKLVSTLDELRERFGEDDNRLAHFLELPAAKPMPKQLRAAVNAYLNRGIAMKMRVVKSDEVERLAALEHGQYISWTRSLASRGGIDPAIVAHWQSLDIPYDQLSEEQKNLDREWARRALSVVEKSDDDTGAAWAAKHRIEDEFEKAAWDEAKHPRGNPENSGEFTSGGGGGASAQNSQAASAHVGGGIAAVSPKIAQHLVAAKFPSQMPKAIARVVSLGQNYRWKSPQDSTPAEGPDGEKWSADKIAERLTEARTQVQEDLSHGSTIQRFDHAPERVAKREQWAERMYHSTPPHAKGERPLCVIVIGPPGAGKSTSLKQYGDDYKARFIEADADIPKKWMDEYRGGVGAAVCHDESSMVKNMVLQRAYLHGDNVIIPIVGYDEAKVRKSADEARQNGYDVDLRLVNVSSTSALQRTTERWIQTGRYVDANYVSNTVDGRPERVYVRLLGDPSQQWHATGATDNNGKWRQWREYHPERGEAIRPDEDA